mgnify:CR=1 FL=1
MKTITKTGCYWYAYKHTEGTIHAKRFFGPEDISEAENSPFVEEVRGPIEGTREDALSLFKQCLTTPENA